MRGNVAQLAAPLVDNRPDAVRIAYRILHRHGNESVRLTHTQREWLQHARSIVDAWERVLADQQGQEDHHAA